MFPGLTAPSRSGRRSPRYQGGWVTAALGIASAILGRKDKKEAEQRADVDRSRELALEERNVKIAEAQDARAGTLFEHYTDTFLPREQGMVDEAFDRVISPARAEARATKDVRSAFDTQRGSTTRRLRSLGVDPTSGSYVGVDRASSLAEAEAEAGQRTAAREGVRDKNFARQMDVLQLGRGLPGTAGNLSAVASGTLSDASRVASARAAGSDAMAGEAGFNYGQAITEAAASVEDLIKARKERKTNNTNTAIYV